MAVTTPPADMELVPPRAYIDRKLFPVVMDYFKDIPGSAWVKQELLLENGKRVRKKAVSFTEDLSPLRFSTFLTMLPDEKGEVRTMEHAFYLAGITSSGRFLQLGNMPYVTTMTSTGTVIAGTAVVGILAVIGVMALIQEENKSK